MYEEYKKFNEITLFKKKKKKDIFKLLNLKIKTRNFVEKLNKQSNSVS